MDFDRLLPIIVCAESIVGSSSDIWWWHEYKISHNCHQYCFGSHFSLAGAPSTYSSRYQAVEGSVFAAGKPVSMQN